MTEEVEPPRSPFLDLVGGRVEEWREGYVKISLTLRDHHTNPHGVMHGGVVTALTDEVMGLVIGSVRGADASSEAPHATVEMNAAFLGAARPGDEIVADGGVLRLGRTVAFGEAEVRRRPDNTLIAKGRFTFVIADRPDR
jgi:acyl-CoA thioesterase